MSYTKLEKMILLSLKDRLNEAYANGVGLSSPAGSAEELGSALDDAFCYWDSTNRKRSQQTQRIIKERFLDIAQCSEEEVRMALYMLWEEGLVKKSPAALQQKEQKKREQPKDGQLFSITETGLRACREFATDI